MEQEHSPSSNNAISSSDFFPLGVEEFEMWFSADDSLAGCTFGSRYQPLGGQRLLGSLLQVSLVPGRTLCSSAGSSAQSWAGVVMPAACLLLWRQSQNKRWSLVTFSGVGKREVQVGEGENTVSCEVRKTFLMLVHCYLPFTVTLWERKILWSMKILKK